MAVSPDSSSLYVKTSDGLVIFDRTPALALTQKAGADGCFTETIVAGCTKAVGLAGNQVWGDIQVSPDGALVYTAFTNPGGVSFFNRFPNGTLTQITGAAGGCISSNGNSAGVADQCVDGNDGLATAYTTATSPDGRYVYVGTADRDHRLQPQPAERRAEPGRLHRYVARVHPSERWNHQRLQHRHHRGRLRGGRIVVRLSITDLLPSRSQLWRIDAARRDPGVLHRRRRSDLPGSCRAWEAEDKSPSIAVACSSTPPR